MASLTIVRAMPFYDPAIQFGGVVSQAREVSRRLAARGHELWVVTTDNGQDPGLPRDRWLDKDGYRVFYAATRPRHRVVPYWTPSVRRPLREVLPRADVLQLNVGLTLTNHIARRLARRAGVPYVYNAEGALCPVRLGIRRHAKRLFLPLVERRVLRDAAAVQALTAKDVDDVVRQGAPRARVHLIPNGVDPAPADRGSRGDARARFGIPAAAPLVLFLGRIHAIKGLDLLLETLHRCPGAAPWLLVAGPDEDGSRPDLERRAAALSLAPRVRFTGTLDGAAKAAAFAAADVFALTSHSEGLPMGVLEACAHGLPCLLTTHCNVPEVESAGAGRVCDADPEALAAALGEILADATARAAMGAAARRLIVEHFSLDRVVEALEALYRSVARGPT